MIRSAPLQRVGHKGAGLIAPGNTFESFDAALAAGVDMIEFDVLPSRDGGELLLAHDYHHADTVQPHTLEEGLGHLASAPFTGVELDVDLKLPGYELRVVEALRRHGFVDRSLISTQYRASLEVIRAEEPRLRLGWTVPKLRRDPFRSWHTRAPAFAGLLALRTALPLLAARAIRDGRCHALMAHWRLVTPRLVRSVLAADGELYAWTVDDLSQLRALEAMGVSGIITNDPRLFSAARDEPRDRT